MTTDLKEIEAQIAEAVRKGKAARRIAAWASVVVKAAVALWMLAVFYELHEIRRQVQHGASSASVSEYHLDRLAKRLAPGY